MDAIKDDSSGGKDHKHTWKHFKEKLRPKPPAGAAWTSTVPVPASDVPMNNRSMSRRHSNRLAEAEYPGGEYKPELSASASRRELRSTPSRKMSLTRNQSRTGDRSLKLQSSIKDFKKAINILNWELKVFAREDIDLYREILMLLM
nr:E3 ubiquitin-protein ligase LUL4 [Ipomoea batatas]